MRLSDMKPPAAKEEPLPAEEAPGSFVLSPEECAAILKAASKRGDDDEEEEYPDDEKDSMQDLWDALSLLDDARDLLNSLVGSYKTQTGCIVAPRHMVAEIERLCSQLTNFLDNWDTSHIKE